MTGYEIAEKLRQLNRWRRGDDETLLMPDPAAIGRWIDAAADALELRDNRAAEIARVTAEMQYWKEWAKEAREMFHKQIDAAAVMKTRAEQAEQLNAELVAALAKSNKDNATLAVQAVRAEQVLRHVAKWTNDGEILERCNKVLAIALAESATPKEVLP